MAGKEVWGQLLGPSSLAHLPTLILPRTVDLAPLMQFAPMNPVAFVDSVNAANLHLIRISRAHVVKVVAARGVAVYSKIVRARITMNMCATVSNSGKKS